ncbi:hypothetical protein CEXT_220551 [Caerostris extrusa]|uniref:Uncharacterized protein n=1 Tax=Caerostris extrusa TaxID=172846 RepID=A0AAV4NK02_CAEEX|nr:hypothetical protein CEXT_220551 [Caerostris extrusa]
MNIHASSLSFTEEKSKTFVVCYYLPRHGPPATWDGEKWHFRCLLVAMGFVKRDTATQCDCFLDIFDLPPTPSGFGISSVNGMFFNRVRENKISFLLDSSNTT